MTTKLDIYNFGRRLVSTRDLDPVYVVLYEGRDMLSGPLLHRWLLAYWCFYHAGTAWYAAGAGAETDYWHRMLVAAGSKAYPRSPERRHYRGSQAVASVSWLAEQGISTLFQGLLRGPVDAASVMARARLWRGFGDWIAFKVADMLERLGLLPVTFDLDTDMYESPRKGAELLWVTEYRGGEYAKEAEERMPGNVAEWACGRLAKSLGYTKAPPRNERLLGPQEYETILCKWKSHMSGHYRVGEDVEALGSALLYFPQCRINQHLHRAGRRVDLL